MSAPKKKKKKKTKTRALYTYSDILIYTHFYYRDLLNGHRRKLTSGGMHNEGVTLGSNLIPILVAAQCY